jgi:iron complex transport system substrate-binding protein
MDRLRNKLGIFILVAGIFLLWPILGLGEVKSGEETLVVKDDFGWIVTFDRSRSPQRIISLAPSNTEILFALGLGDKIVGVTDYCDYPPEAKKIVSIGGYSTPNIERIVSQNPDLILVAIGNGRENISLLKDLGFSVVALNPQSLEGILKNIELIGEITGSQKQAEELIFSMRGRIEVIREKVRQRAEKEKPRVLYVVWYPELWVAGSKTFPNELIEIAGGQNIAAEIKEWKIMNKESVVGGNPEVIICSGHTGASYIIRDNILKDIQFQSLRAIKSGRVYPVADPDTTELSGPRILEGLEEIYHFLWDQGN